MWSVNQLLLSFAVLLWVLAGCSDLKPKSGKLVCGCDADCPPHWICGEDKRCYPPGPDGGDECLGLESETDDTRSTDGDTDTTETDSDTLSDIVDAGITDAGDGVISDSVKR